MIILNNLNAKIMKTKSFETSILGYFVHGGVKWILIQRDGRLLTGIDITPKGKIHKLHILETSVQDLVLLDE